MFTILVRNMSVYTVLKGSRIIISVLWICLTVKGQMLYGIGSMNRNFVPWSRSQCLYPI